MNSIDFESLGDESKKFESVGTGLKFPPGGLLMARLDGNAFHTFTKSMVKPLDKELSLAMVETARELCKEFNCVLAYVQSDEITLLWDLTQPKKPGTIFPFDGKAAKLNSIIAGFTAVTFNDLLAKFRGNVPYPLKKGIFDCRVWPIPDRAAAIRTLIWRQWDAEKNSVSSLASNYISSPQLYKRNTKERIAMLRAKGINWEDFPLSFRFGTLILPKIESMPIREEIRLKIREDERPEPGTMVDRKVFNTYTIRLLNFKDEAEIEASIFPNKFICRLLDDLSGTNEVREFQV
jgi:tRNA(His) 5'-end guanylyltransferase